MRRPTYSLKGGELRPIGAIAVEVVENIAVRATSHWLLLADQVTGKDRTACLETADAILRKAGLRWGDFIPRKAA